MSYKERLSKLGISVLSEWPAKLPKSDPPKKRHQLPLPLEFLVATVETWELPEKDRKAIKRPFTQVWEKAWAKLARNRQFSGVSDRYKRFREEGGIECLKTLAKKGAKPNFILSLFIKYLWNDHVNDYEHQSVTVTDLQKKLESVQTIKSIYQARSMLTKGIDRWVSLMVEKSLCDLEANTQDDLEAIDVRRVKQKGPRPLDKSNRVIFTLHEYLKQNTGGPQWEVFWKLLAAAGVLGSRGSSNLKQGFIKPRVKTFQRYHPKEARFIKECVIPLGLSSVSALRK